MSGSVSWVYWWCALGLAGALLPAGCTVRGDAAAEERAQTGTLSMALGGIGSRGTRFRLKDATFTVAGPSPRVFSSNDFLSQDHVEFSLAGGSYTLTLSAGWFLERLTTTGFERVEKALLLSEPVVPFTVVPNSTTTVPVQFQVGEEVVTVQNGTLSVDVGIAEVGLENGNTANCGNGTVDPGEDCDDSNSDPCDGCAGCKSHTAPPPGPTAVPALIAEDTVWCAVQSPLRAASNVVVLQGATLLVGPGARVEFDSGVGLEVRGKLGIAGSADAPAVFTSSEANPGRDAWTGIAMMGNTFETAIDHAVIQHSRFGFTNAVCCGARTTIRNSLFTENQNALFVSGTVEDSTFTSNDRGVQGFGLTIRRSTFEDNGEFAAGASAIEDCTFIGNGLGPFPKNVFVCGPSDCEAHGAAVQNADRVERSVFKNNDAAVANVGELVDSEVRHNQVAVVSGNSIRGTLIADNGVGVASFADILASTLVRNGGYCARAQGKFTKARCATAGQSKSFHNRSNSSTRPITSGV